MDTRLPGNSAQGELQDFMDYSTIRTISKIESQSTSSNTLLRNGGKRRLTIKINPKIVADSILGLSDGLTVPFALTAGLTEFGNTNIVVLGGLAELIAGAISMGLGGFVGAKSEAESYQATARKCDALIQLLPTETLQIIKTHFQQYEVPKDAAENIGKKLMGSPDQLKLFLMRHHFDAAEPPNSRPYVSAMTLAVSYFAGGFIPLVPYFFVPKNKVNHGLYWSIGVMAIVLILFGYAKTCVVRGWRGGGNILAGMKGALQMLIVGSLAAGAAVGLVRLINRHHSVP